MLKLYYLNYREIPVKERIMKNYFKTLLALMLALVAVFAFAGYAAASAAPDADTAAPTIPEPDDF